MLAFLHAVFLLLPKEIERIATMTNKVILYIPLAEFKRENIIFCSSFYDYPLCGLFLHDGKICSFYSGSLYDLLDPENIFYEIGELSLVEKIKKICSWKLFELCVGTHWSYPYGEKQYLYDRKDGSKEIGYKRRTSYHLRKPKRFWKWIFMLYYRKTNRFNKNSSIKKSD
jgi:hypothetical protein